MRNCHGNNSVPCILGETEKVSNANSALGQIIHIAYLRVTEHLEPLTMGINVSQQSNTHLDEVLSLFAKLYHHYTSLLESNYLGNYAVKVIVESLSKQWLDLDQELFILALVLNPFISCHILALLSSEDVINMGKRMYKRVFQMDNTGRLRLELHHYLQRIGTFWHRYLADHTGLGRIFTSKQYCCYDYSESTYILQKS